MKNIFTILPLLLLGLSLNAQEQKPAEEIEVRKTIKSLFDGMRAGDSTAVRNCFTLDAAMHTTFTDKEGKASIQTGSVDGFCEAVGTAHDDVWDEKIWSYDIQVDDRLASVWTEYTFFLGDKQSHCGVNAFLLFKSDEGWKIVSLMDTRRRKDCKS